MRRSFSFSHFTFSVCWAVDGGTVLFFSFSAGLIFFSLLVFVVGLMNF